MRDTITIKSAALSAGVNGLQKGGKRMKSVRIEKNSDGSYSAYIFDHCVETGTYEKCAQTLSYHNEYV